MAAKRRPRHSAKKKSSQSKARGPAAKSPNSEEAIELRRVRGGEGAEFELVHPRSVRDRDEDLEEVRTMLAAGESDIAVDELRWLLSGCPVLLEAHKLLGEIALGEGDMELAQSHFGVAYEMGLAALGRGFSGKLPYARKANQPFFEAGKGLALCLRQAGEYRLATEVVRRLLTLDPADPLGLESLP
jgi:tetratricopeptide (TPR) repeat protein